MPEASVEGMVQAVRERAYRLTVHAEHEREADAISVVELEEAFGSEILEILENYPNDPRGSSALFLGFTSAGNPLHAVVSASSPDIVVFVTVMLSNMGNTLERREGLEFLERSKPTQG